MEDINVPQKVEAALRYKMRTEAMRRCEHKVQEYSDCSSNRTLSIIWACREQFNALNDCCAQYTTKEILNEHKRQYLATLQE